MNTTKTIEMVAAPREPHFVGDGFRVHNFIPSQFRLDMARMNPFIMLDYNSKFYFPPSEQPKGVGVHPHKGFETVTIAYQGKVAHHDSAGNSGVIHEGDVQWMTAASGVMHKEYHEANFSKSGGLFQMVQLWVNLPAKDKKTAPKYQGIENANMPKFVLPNEAGLVEVIAGEYNGLKGAADTFTPVHLMNGKLKKGGKATFQFPAHYNTGLLVIEGTVKIQEQDIDTDHFVLFHNDGDTFEVEATSDAVFLVLSGEPIQEPIFAYGPFVMNTRDEIVEAYREFNTGKYGYLED